ncbi:hypothetical protein Dsin_029076 [Dipteronia sinensis]|uniref:Uncharacterized protein n=1 Tax=Dipteronia sinensis TaxID=43782 RepID=A0AAD9ZSF4_9ROSI|nr:hypothetical protein Dsin_029076 [Dipteronia sinensis]
MVMKSIQWLTIIHAQISYLQILGKVKIRFLKKVIIKPTVMMVLNPSNARDNFFTQRRDNVGRLGLFALQKITAVFRMLAYGLPADVVDEYIKIEESTAIESLKRICGAVVEEFKDGYL